MITPGQAIRKFCIRCTGSAYQIKHCGGERVPDGFGENRQCFFYPYRLRKGRPSVKLIRKMCRECQGNSNYHIRHCPHTDCPLYPFRFGKNPNYKPRASTNLKIP